MSKIIKPFGRVVSRVVIEVDQNQQVKIEAVEVLMRSVKFSFDELKSSPVPMNPLKFALLLTSVLTSVLGSFKLPGEFKNAEKTESASSNGD